MKQYTLTLTEDEAHAVGYALNRVRQELHRHPGHDEHTLDLLCRTEAAITKLDTCPETPAPEAPESFGNRVLVTENDSCFKH